MEYQKEFDMLKEDGFPVQWYEGHFGQGFLLECDGHMNPH